MAIINEETLLQRIDYNTGLIKKREIIHTGKIYSCQELLDMGFSFWEIHIMVSDKYLDKINPADIQLNQAQSI